MAAVSFHAQLSMWAKAKNFEELSNKVLDHSSIPHLLFRESKTCEKINNLICKNIKKLIAMDLNSLEKLQGLVNRLSSSKIENYDKNNPPISILLKETIASSIELTKIMGENHLPSTLNNITLDYLTLMEKFNFFICGNQISRRILEESILKITETELEEFCKSVIENSTKNPSVFNIMIYYFFKYASSNILDHFFSKINLPGNTEILSKIILAMPKKMTILNFEYCYSMFHSNHLKLVLSHFNTITSLNLCGCTLSEDSLIDMADNSKIKTLINLNLDKIKPEYCDETLEQGIIALIKNPNLQFLQKLELSVSSNSFLEIIKSPFKNLSSLSLFNCDLNRKVLSEFRKSKLLINLKELTLSECILDNEGFTSLFQSSNVASLTKLEFFNCNLKDKIMAIATCPYLSKLKYLKFNDSNNNNIFYNNFIEELATNPHIKNLEHLFMVMGNLKDSTIYAMAHSSNFRKLKSLDISYNLRLTDESLTIISFGAVFKELEFLEIWSCFGMTEDGIITLMQSPVNTKLNTINHHVEISKETKRELNKILKMRQLNLHNPCLEESKTSD